MSNCPVEELILTLADHRQVQMPDKDAPYIVKTFHKIIRSIEPSLMASIQMEAEHIKAARHEAARKEAAEREAQEKLEATIKSVVREVLAEGAQ